MLIAESAARRGELLLARLRVRLILILAAVQWLPGWDPLRRQVGLATCGVALLLSWFMLRLVRRRFRPWMSVATAAIDVTFVTASLAAFAWLGKPLWAVNNKLTFEVYLVAIGGAALRFDWRVCVFTGGLAVVQYAALVAAVARTWSLSDVRLAPWEDGMFSWEVQIGRLVLLASAAVISTAVVRRAEKLYVLSTTDRLTGLDNRGVFESRLAEEMVRAARYQHPFSVALVDIDSFKRLNDTKGHAEGDRRLCVVAQLLRRRLRGSDVAARYGGDEFALLLPETGHDEAMALLEELRAAVASHVDPEASPPEEPLTCSAGLAAWPDDAYSAKDLLAAADSRLYEAKRGGRDRVIGRPVAATGPKDAVGEAH
ncbi:MAG TPA: GGDEF domain-containing protein [Vicinamibacteria bacterium]|nr:GGDEF domain-containing protein [Vicinamibacteria bacterium]